MILYAENNVHVYVHVQVQESEDNAKEILQILITTLAGVTKGDCTDSGMSSYYYELSNATSLFQFMLKYD